MQRREREEARIISLERPKEKRCKDAERAKSERDEGWVYLSIIYGGTVFCESNAHREHCRGREKGDGVGKGEGEKREGKFRTGCNERKEKIPLWRV